MLPACSKVIPLGIFASCLSDTLMYPAYVPARPGDSHTSITAAATQRCTSCHRAHCVAMLLMCGPESNLQLPCDWVPQTQNCLSVLTAPQYEQKAVRQGVHLRGTKHVSVLSACCAELSNTMVRHQPS